MTARATIFWAHMAWCFLVRSGRSTAALSIMVVTAVSALIFLSATAVGVNDAMLRNTVELFSGHITGHDLPPSLSPEELRVKGVKGVLKRVYLPGVLSNPNFGKSLVICGIDPGRENTLTALKEKVVEGRYPENNRPELMISKSLARELAAPKGATLIFTSKHHSREYRMTVSGIYQTRIDLLDRDMAFFSLDTLSTKDALWTAAVFLQNGVSTEAVINEYRRKWPTGFRFESWATLMPDLSQLIDLEMISMGIVIVLVFGVVAIGIACSFVIFIIKNMREYGIMKAMGVSNQELSALIVLKVVLMNGAACSVGLLLGSIAVYAACVLGGIDLTAFTSHNQYFSVSGIIYPRLTFFSLLAPPATAFFFSLLAAVWPASLLAGKKTADILRMV